jgi:hypothetical protein
LLRTKKQIIAMSRLGPLLLDDGKEAIASLITIALEAAAIRVGHPPGKPSSLIASLQRMPVLAFGKGCLGPADQRL